MYNDSQTRLYNVLMGNKNVDNRVLPISINSTKNEESTPIDFIKKRLGSIGNAIGTTFSAIASPFKNAAEDTSTEMMLNRQKNSLDDIAKKYGYESKDAYWDARDAAEAAGDKAKLAEMDRTIGEELKAQTRANSEEATKKAKNFEDYRKNNLISKNLNQDRGKFAGSAINTLSTGFDVLSMAAGIPNGPGINAIQGGIEGLADELEQNGLENFDEGRALSNIASGAAAGLATGGLNKAIGGRSLVPAKGKVGGAIGSVLNSGIGRGALSGAVGGAVGAGTSAALNGQDVLGSVLEGAKQGALQGGVAGGLMSGANRLTNSAINRFSPETAQRMQNNAQAWDNWKNSGEDFNERLTNTLTSGDSAVGNWIQGKQSGALGTIGNIGDRVQDVSGVGQRYTYVDPLTKEITYYTPDDIRQLAQSFESEGNYRMNRGEPKYVNLNEEGTKLLDIYARNTDNFDDYGGGNNYLDKIRNIREVGSDANKRFMNWVNEAATQETPTTLGGWVKKAGERAVEDINNTNLGNRIQSVNELPEDVRNMRINDNMANIAEEFEPGKPLTKEIPSQKTQVYRTFTKEQEPIAESFNKQANPQTEALETKFANKTSKEAQLRNAAGLKLQQQYGTIDKPTAKATNAPETLREIAEAGFTKPADVERMADAITGSNGEVSKLVANLVKTAKPINTFDGETSGQTLKDYIDLSINKNGLDGIREGKAVRSQIDALMKSLPSRAEGSVTFVDDPTDVFKLTQKLDAEAANYEGRSGMNYGTTTPDKLRAAKVIKEVSSLLKNKIYDSADVKTALTPEVAESLKSLDPNNEAWANHVDNKIMTAKSAADLRTVQKPWVRAKKIIDNGYLNSVTYGGRVGNNLGLPLTPNGLKAAALNATINSKPGLRAQAKLLNKAADITANFEDGASKATGEAPATSKGNSLTTAEAAKNVPSQAIWNQIGRSGGLTQGEQARTANYLADAVNATNANASTLEDLLAPNAGSTSVYDTMYGTTSQPTTQTQVQQGASYFPTTGDYWTDILGTALTSAINADDADAFATLYSMYQDAIAQAQKSSASASSGQKLTSTQQRANAAMNSLERLSGMTPDTGYNLSGIPIIGDIATFGGNDYEGEAKSLAQQIGYMVSGANIKEEEAYNIGKAYVPQPFDSEQTRQNKLRRAYEIIQQYQNGMAEE